MRFRRFNAARSERLIEAIWRATMTDTDISTIEVTKELDCVGMFCPMPIYKASIAMKDLQAGQVLKVLSTDLGSVADFPSFARQAKHDLLATDEQDGVHIFFIRKGVN